MKLTQSQKLHIRLITYIALLDFSSNFIVSTGRNSLSSAGEISLQPSVFQTLMYSHTGPVEGEGRCILHEQIYVCIMYSETSKVDHSKIRTTA